MKKIILIPCFIVSVLLVKAQFRVIGYLPVGAGLQESMGKIAFDKITHLNIAFINPDSTATFMQVAGLDSIVAKAHARHVKVCMSIGGGSAPAYYQVIF